MGMSPQRTSADDQKPLALRGPKRKFFRVADTIVLAFFPICPVMLALPGEPSMNGESPSMQRRHAWAKQYNQ